MVERGWQRHKQRPGTPLGAGMLPCGNALASLPTCGGRVDSKLPPRMDRRVSEAGKQGRWAAGNWIIPPLNSVCAALSTAAGAAQPASRLGGRVHSDLEAVALPKRAPNKPSMQLPSSPRCCQCRRMQPMVHVLMTKPGQNSPTGSLPSQHNPARAA